MSIPWGAIAAFAGAGATAYSANSASNAAASGISGNIDANREMYNFNREQAIKTRQWQAQMSNTSAQRAAADLKEAGYNPILSGNPGAGASTPAGATAKSGNVIAQPAANPSVIKNQALLNFLSSALEVRQKTEQTRRESALADIAESKVPTSNTKASFMDGLWKGLSNWFGMDYQEMGEKSVIPLAVGAAGIAGAKGLSKVLKIPINNGVKFKSRPGSWKHILWPSRSKAELWQLNRKRKNYKRR